MRMQEQSDDGKSGSVFGGTVSSGLRDSGSEHTLCMRCPRIWPSEWLLHAMLNTTTFPCFFHSCSSPYYFPNTASSTFKSLRPRAHEMDPNNVVKSEIDAKYSSLGSRPNTSTPPVDASVPYRDTEREDEATANKNMQANTEEENEKAGKAAVIIQKHYRGHVARKNVQELRLSVISCSICRKCHEPHIQKSF